MTIHHNRMCASNDKSGQTGTTKSCHLWQKTAQVSGTSFAPKNRKAGFTLLEIAIYSALLVVIGAPIVSAVLTSTRTTTENDTFNRITERNRTALSRLEREVRTCLTGSLVVGGSGGTLTMTPAVGFDGTAVIAGPAITCQFQLTSGETANGQDDDGNGLIDEGELVRTDSGTGAQIVITGGIDLVNSGFVLTGTGVTVTVASVGSLDRRYGTYTVTRSSTMFPRN